MFKITFQDLNLDTNQRNLDYVQDYELRSELFSDIKTTTFKSIRNLTPTKNIRCSKYLSQYIIL